MGAGNPNFIASGWGELTKAMKLPVRIAERIQELREDGEDVDDILGRLDQEQNSSVDKEVLEEAIELLQEALSLKASSGGAIKAQIKKALELLGVEPE